MTSSLSISAGDVTTHLNWFFRGYMFTHSSYVYEYVWIMCKHIRSLRSFFTPAFVPHHPPRSAVSCRKATFHRFPTACGIPPAAARHFAAWLTHKYVLFCLRKTQYFSVSHSFLFALDLIFFMSVQSRLQKTEYLSVFPLFPFAEVSIFLHRSPIFICMDFNIFTMFAQSHLQKT